MIKSVVSRTDLEAGIPSNYYLERIQNFKALSKEAKLNIYEKVHSIFSSCYGPTDFEVIPNYYNELPGDLMVLMLKSKIPDESVGFAICATDSVYLRDENTSKENLFKVTYNSYCLHPSHRGQSLGTHMFNAAQVILQECYGGHNRISFNYFGSIFVYKLFYETTRFVYPGPFELPNYNIRELFLKVKSKYQMDDVKEISESVVEIKNSNQIGFDKERYLREHPNLDPVSKFYADAFDFRPGFFLVGLFVHEMIEGNTLELEPRVYEKLSFTDYEFQDFIENI